MSRWLPTLVTVLACGASGMGFAAEAHTEDFAYGMPIKTPAAGTAYRLTLPVEVFMKVAHVDLRDVRVFNARGDVVPYELRPTSPEPTTRAQGPSLPLYPLHGDARASLHGLRLTIHSEGTALDLQAPGAAPDAGVITSYVIDARAITAPLSGIQIHWADGAREFSGSVRLESSDDLDSWRLVKSDAAVIHLATGGSQLIQNRLEFPSTRARFWRLTWVGKTAPVELTSATAEVAVDQPRAPQSSVTVSGAHNGKESELSFDLGANLPVTQVNLLLPESNSVLKMEILSRARTTDPWRQVTYGEFYRVSDGGTSEHHNGPLPIPTDSDRFWLIRPSQPAVPIGNVTLQVTWDAMDVVFLAQGAGPFVLAFGNASVGPSGVALEPLIKGITLLPAETGPSYVLGGAERLRPPPKTVPWRMAALWVTLGLGVLLLAWMAYRLSKEMGARPAA